MNSDLRTKGALQQRIGNLIAGTQKYFPIGPQMVGGVTSTVSLGGLAPWRLSLSAAHEPYFTPHP
jgi:hypothetical protein